MLILNYLPLNKIAANNSGYLIYIDFEPHESIDVKSISINISFVFHKSV